MSEFYHFTIGYNHWMVVIPIITAGLLLLAFFGVYVTERGRIRIRWTAKVPCIVGGAGVSVMLFVESWRGILQWCDNHLRKGESPLVSTLIASFGLLFAGAMYWFVVSALCEAVQSARYEHLKECAARVEKRTAHALSLIQEMEDEWLASEIGRICECGTDDYETFHSREAAKRAEEVAEIVRSQIVIDDLDVDDFGGDSDDDLDEIFEAKSPEIINFHDFVTPYNYVSPFEGVEILDEDFEEGVSP